MNEIQARRYHNSVEGRRKFQDIVTSDTRKLLDVKSVPRKLLSAEKLPDGTLSIYNVSNAVYIQSHDPLEVNTSTQQRLFVPLFSIDYRCSIKLSGNVQQRFLTLANLHEIASAHFANLEMTCFSRLLDQLIVSNDDITNLVNYHYVFCNNITRQQCKALQQLSSSRVFELPNIDDSTLLACKNSIVGGMPIRSSIECLASDDEMQRELGYTFYEDIGMYIQKQDVVKITDRSLDMAVNKFQWMTQ